MPTQNTELQHTHSSPKVTTRLAAIITSVEALSTLIEKPAIKNVVAISAPFISYGLLVLGKSVIHLIECARGIKIYKQLIIENETELNNNPSTGRRKQLERELNILRSDLKQVQKANVKIIIF